MIEVRELTKHFPGPDGPKVAVDSIHFSVRPGEVFGLLGPNGAGKTTTLRILCTVLKPTYGSANVAGFDVETQESEVRRHVGFLSASVVNAPAGGATRRLWLDYGPLIIARWMPSSRCFVEVMAGALVPVRRDRIRIEPYKLVSVAPPIGWTMGVGVGWRL